jgi:MFS superfamily sulfate permease-like transporter
MVFGILIPTAILSSIIVLIVMFVSAARKNTRKERLHVIKAIYFYAISFITLIMVIGGGVALFMAASDVISPATYLMSEQDYKMSNKTVDGTGKDTSTLTDAQWQEKYEAYKKTEEERAKKQALNSLVKSLGWIVIPAPIFMYTQRRIRELKSEI